mmetsp:Transcript_5744/g.12127  ORF Transcript_5744/g.12127 Transcript_5744/m.12127 type:complete len:764 (-) Transcript_5744:50-2341(-)
MSLRSFVSLSIRSDFNIAISGRGAKPHGLIAHHQRTTNSGKIALKSLRDFSVRAELQNSRVCSLKNAASRRCFSNTRSARKGSIEGKSSIDTTKMLEHLQAGSTWLKKISKEAISNVYRLKSDQSKGTHMRIFQTLLQHVWPSKIGDTDDETKQKMFAAIQERKRRVLFSLGLLFAGKAVTIQVPFIFKYLVDSLPNAQSMADVANMTDPTTLGVWPVALLLGYGTSRAASSAFQEWRNAVFMHVAQDAIRITGRNVFDHVQSLDLQFHLSKNTGKVARIMDRGQRSIQFVLNAMVFHIAPTILEVSLVSGLLAWQFGMAHANVALLTVLAYGSFTVGITQWRTKFRRDMNRLENQASSRVVDSLMNYETVHYFNNIKHEGDRYEESLRGYQTAALQAQSSLSLLNVGQAAIFSVGLTTLMWLTSTQIMNGAASVGDLVLVNGLLFQLSVPLFFIGGVYREVRQSLIDMEQMYDLADTKSSLVTAEKPLIFQPEVMGTALTMDNVYFSYPSRFGPSENAEEGELKDAYQGRSILRGTSLNIPAGSTVAVVGTSGCGKSTLLRLWYRFYDATTGRVLVGGQDVRDLDLDSLRRNIAVIPQDTVLFHESVWYNLQYANLSASNEEIINAAQKAQLHESILSFPQGYDTVVGERGLKLSGGEKQRLAIARAMLKNDAPILLCDEPTSALDSTTESHIMANIKGIRDEGRTMVIVAHRLSTVKDADIIMVMDKGRVVEHGSHNQLLALQDGRYSEMWRRQESAGSLQ